MLFGLVTLLTTFTFLYVHCYIPVPIIYQKAESALTRYSSQIEHSPVIFSLLNVIIHDKLTRPFIVNQAIETCLADVKKFNSDDEEILRDFIYNYQQPILTSTPTNKLKNEIQSALDLFFSEEDLDDHGTLNILSSKIEPKSQ